jgi:hypothetical protein
MRDTRQKATHFTRRAQERQHWPVGRSLAGVAAFTALGLLAACGSVTNTASQLAAPKAMAISQATAKESTAQPTRKAAPKQAKQPRADTVATKPSASGTSTRTPGATPTGGTSGPLDPSGQNPATTLSGFTLKYVQEFNGDRGPADWNIYNSVPGGDTSQMAQWVPSMCTFSGGEAHFMASGVDSCGMKYLGQPQEYGAWFARLKADAEPTSVSFSDIFLLWPDNEQWPPEIDIYEDGANRSRTYASMVNGVSNICGSSPSQSCVEEYEQDNWGSGGVANSDTEWHTYGVEWTPSGASWLIDGRVVYTALASQVKSPALPPAQPMDMALQSQNITGDVGTPTLLETMTLDWVEQFSWNG